MIGALLFRIGVGATPFLLPLLLQVGFGMTPFQSGMITFAAAVGAIAMKFAAPPILRRYGFRNVLVVNAVIAGGLRRAAGSLHAGDAGRADDRAAPRSAASSARCSSPASTRSPSPTCRRTRMSRATTLTSVAQQLSLSLGISIGAIALE